MREKRILSRWHHRRTMTRSACAELEQMIGNRERLDRAQVHEAEPLDILVLLHREAKVLPHVRAALRLLLEMPGYHVLSCLDVAACWTERLGEDVR